MCGTLCAPARADEHTCLQLAWLPHACHSRSAIAASHLPGARQLVAIRCAKRSGMRHLLCTREHPCALARTRGTLCAAARARAHAWLQLAWLQRVQALGQRDRSASPARPSPALGAAFAPPVKRFSSARSASTTLYNQLCAARARSCCGCAKSSGMRHLLRTHEHVCARVRARGTLCAAARAHAHAWLQLARLRHWQCCGSAVAALHQLGRRRHCDQRPPRLTTRLGKAR
jgi:hypothetical protein